MVRTPTVFLDTHIVVWLAGGYVEKVNAETQALIEHAELLISPAAMLELQCLYEIGRIRETATDALSGLHRALGLRVASEPFSDVVSAALTESWTRDPFDRLIVAHARMLDAVLISHDRRIAEAYGNTQ